MDARMVVYMNTDTLLVGTLNRDRTGYAGKHDKHLPAGTLVEFDPELCSEHGWHVARVYGRPRVKVWVRLNDITPA